LSYNCNQKQKKVSKIIYDIPGVAYPGTKKVEVKDVYFGNIIPDPYRWLEDDTATDVKNWVAEQNKVTINFLDKIPFRTKFRKRLEEIFSYSCVTSPVKAGDYYIYFKNDGLQNRVWNIRLL
jgi:prolyl oligopeptidase